MTRQSILKSLLFAAVLFLWNAVHAGTVTYVYTDPQGTPLAEADANGNITATFDYRPYGTQVLGNVPNGPGYTSHVNDPDTGLIYMQARYYDPVAGRFMSSDPIGVGPGDVFGFSRFTYAGNNPVMRTDPDGRQSEADCSFACRFMRKVSDRFSGFGDNQGEQVGRGLGGQISGTRVIASYAAADGMREVADATDPVINAIPGGSIALCATDGCNGLGWLMAVVAVVPAEGAGEAIGEEIAAKALGNQNPLYKAAVGVFKDSDLSNAGRALTKHPEIIGETKATLRQNLRTDGAINDAAHAALRDIMRNGVTTNPTLARYGTVTQIQIPGGFGARWASDGSFIGIINP